MKGRSSLIGWVLWLCACLTACAPAAAGRSPAGEVTPSPLAASPRPAEETALTRTPLPVSAERTEGIPSTTPTEGGPREDPTGAPSTSTPRPVHTSTPVRPERVPTRAGDLPADAWKDLPVLPALNDRALAILRDGLAKGNNPRVFSKIGDCESQTVWFLGDFDLGPKNYALGPYEQDFTPVIDFYQGSFNRLSLAARPGFTAASVSSPIWADRQACQKNETPLACEVRVNRPLLAFVLLGTNDASNPKTFEGHTRKIIEYLLSQGVLPILGTKADNVEGDESINRAIARLAYQYDLPLWNYWAAIQDLPHHGLQPDGVHLTFGPTRFDTPKNLKNAWPVRNLNAMQILKKVMEATEP